MRSAGEQRTQDLAVREMTREEVDLAVEWAAAESWNPRLPDADSFFAADPNGFWLGTLDGEPIGCVSTVAYDERFGFLGFYIARYAGRLRDRAHVHPGSAGSIPEPMDYRL